MRSLYSRSIPNARRQRGAIRAAASSRVAWARWRSVAVSSAVMLLACHHRVEPSQRIIPAGPFLFTTTEPLCRGVRLPGYSFSAPIHRVDPLTGIRDEAIPIGTVGLFEVDHFDEGRYPMVHLKLMEVIIGGRHLAVSGARANSNPESVAAADELVCVPPGSRFVGMLTEDVKAK